jgi:hypothetical protein
MNSSTTKSTGMRKKRYRFYFIPFFVIGAIALFTWIVMLLWNGVVTEVFNVKAINFWQAAGLLILSKILFSSFRPGSSGRWRKGGSPWRNKFMNMSPEEREHFKKEWQKRCGDPNSGTP